MEVIHSWISPPCTVPSKITQWPNYERIRNYRGLRPNWSCRCRFRPRFRRLADAGEADLPDTSADGDLAAHPDRPHRDKPAEHLRLRIGAPSADLAYVRPADRRDGPAAGHRD